MLCQAHNLPYQNGEGNPYYSVRYEHRHHRGRERPLRLQQDSKSGAEVVIRGVAGGIVERFRPPRLEQPSFRASLWMQRQP